MLERLAEMNVPGDASSHIDQNCAVYVVEPVAPEVPARLRREEVRARSHTVIHCPRVHQRELACHAFSASSLLYTVSKGFIRARLTIAPQHQCMMCVFALLRHLAQRCQLTTTAPMLALPLHRVLQNETEARVRRQTLATFDSVDA